MIEKPSRYHVSDTTGKVFRVPDGQWMDHDEVVEWVNSILKEVEGARKEAEAWRDEAVSLAGAHESSSPWPSVVLPWETNQ